MILIRKSNSNPSSTPNTSINKPVQIPLKRLLSGIASFNGNAIFKAQAKVTSLGRAILGSESESSRIIKATAVDADIIVKWANLTDKKGFVSRKKDFCSSG